MNNAGILRDRTLESLSEEDWDLVVHVHMKGHFSTTRHAGAYWRDQFKAGNLLQPTLINTTSVVGLFGNFGQANYSSAKGAIAAFTLIAQMELGQYGVRCNAISPYAKTRLTGAEGGVADDDPLNPAHAAPFVGYLATADCLLDGKVFFVTGGDIRIIRPWQFMDGSELHRDIVADGTWTIERCARAAGPLVEATSHREMKKATSSS